MKPPVQAPRIAGPPAIRVNATSRGTAERRAAVGRRRGDPEPFGHVVDHEADDQERAERELSERERRSDREPLAEVVQPDSDRDQRGERDAAEDAVRVGREAAGDERHRQEARRHPEQHEARASERARAALPAAGTPRTAPRRRGTRAGPPVRAMNAVSHRWSTRRSDGNQSSPSATGSTPTRKPMIP